MCSANSECPRLAANKRAYRIEGVAGLWLYVSTTAERTGLRAIAFR